MEILMNGTMREWAFGLTFLLCLKYVKKQIDTEWHQNFVRAHHPDSSLESAHKIP